MDRVRGASGFVRTARTWGICVALATGVVWLASSGSAFALTVTAPPDTGTSLTATVTVDPAETAGSIDFAVDGVVVATQPGTPGAEVGFSGLALVPGQHRLAATLHGTGGDVVASEVIVTAWAPPSPPVLLSPSGPAISYLSTAVIRAGANTSQMHLFVSGQPAGSSAVTPGAEVRFDGLGIPVPTDWIVYSVVVSNPIGQTATYDWGFHLVPVQYPTMIVIEKSRFQLHWIVNYQLVKTYPIAHGKGNNTPVKMWMINAKYVTDAGGVYGPRKMRLYKYQGGSAGRRGRRGRPGRWVFTAYGIHGTNQPWVIGTMASHGCVRMYNWDILELWPQVPLGTMAETRR